MTLNGNKLLYYKEIESKIFIVEMLMSLLNFDHLKKILLIHQNYDHCGHKRGYTYQLPYF